MTNEELRKTVMRLLASRTSLVSYLPFFSRLLLKLKIGIADCETAYTDMENVVFDPQFAKRLSDEELEFVFLHEVLHCVLDHCTRGQGLNNAIYNIACDLVVNSVAFDILGMKSFTVDGSNVMHLTPSGVEGREYTAEDIYEMLFRASPDDFDDFCKFNGINTGGADTGASTYDMFSALFRDCCVDSHGEWDSIKNTGRLRDEWKNAVRNAARACSGGSGMPDGIRRHLREITAKAEVNWRQVLNDFIKQTRSDYTFSPPDRRYTGDIIMPSFRENVYGSYAENIWFLVDTSGSVSDDEISGVYGELVSCISQMDGLEGRLSFFDTHVTDPVDFTDEDELVSIKPTGGGGTSFYAIFDYLKNKIPFSQQPSAAVILTDGCAPFPPEDAAMGVPVIWIITGSTVKPPWGVTVNAD